VTAQRRYDLDIFDHFLFAFGHDLLLPDYIVLYDPFYK